MRTPRDIDLRLLECLVALVAERSVTRAAERIGVSQPRMSNILSRLRRLFDDPLLVRSKLGMTPTERAMLISTSVRAGLAHIDAALELQRPFDPARVEDVHFVLAMSDYVATLMMPRLMSHLAEVAPKVRVSIKMTDPARVREWLDAGECDMAFGLFMQIGESLRASVLSDDTASCIASKGHPIDGASHALEAFAAASHAVMGGYPAPVSTLEQMVDSACAERGFARAVAIRAPSLVLLANIVANTQLVATIPTSLSLEFERSFAIQRFATPFPLPAMNVTMIWHERSHRHAAHSWLRGEIRQVMRTTGAGR